MDLKHLKNRHFIALCICAYLVTISLTLLFPYPWAMASPVAVVRGIIIGIIIGVLNWRH